MMKDKVNTILKAWGLKAEEIKLMDAKLKDGETTVSADPDFEAGASIMVMTEDEQSIPMPVNAEGEAYELEDGRTFTVVEEGVIAEVKEAGAEEEAPAEEEEVAASDKPTEAPVPKAVIESIVKETKFSKEEMDAKDVEIELLKAQLELSKEVEVVEKIELAKGAIENPSEKSTKKVVKKEGRQTAESTMMNFMANR